MARVISDGVNFSYNGTSLEGSLQEVNQDVDVAEAEITSFSDAWGNFVAGKKNVVTQLRGKATQSATLGERLLIAGMGGGPKSTIFDLTGSGPGANDPQYKCTASGLTGALVSRVSISLSPDGAGEYEATLQHSGDTTRLTA